MSDDLSMVVALENMNCHNGTQNSQHHNIKFIHMPQAPKSSLSLAFRSMGTLIKVKRVRGCLHASDFQINNEHLRVSALKLA